MIICVIWCTIRMNHSSICMKNSWILNFEVRLLHTKKKKKTKYSGVEIFVVWHVNEIPIRIVGMSGKFKKKLFWNSNQLIYLRNKYDNFSTRSQNGQCIAIFLTNFPVCKLNDWLIFQLKIVDTLIYLLAKWSKYVWILLLRYLHFKMCFLYDVCIWDDPNAQTHSNV